MIAEFRIKNFYSFKSEQRLSFEPTTDSSYRNQFCIEVKDGVSLLKIGMIYGANASGKTNILTALSFFRNLMCEVPRDQSVGSGFYPFLLDDNSGNELGELGLSFYLDGERYELSVAFDQQRIYSEKMVFYPGSQPAVLYHRRYKTDTESTEIRFGSKSGIGSKGQMAIAGSVINNCSVMAAFGKSNVASPRLNLVYLFFSKGIRDLLPPDISWSNYTMKQLDRDRQGELRSFLIRFLKASDFNISDVTLKKEEITITPGLEKMIQSLNIMEEAKIELFKQGKSATTEMIFSHQTDQGEYTLPGSLESRGTIRFMGLVVLLYQLLKENCVICLDEVESSLHFELFNYLLKVYLANGKSHSQLILTTHELSLLEEDFIRRDAIWFTEKSTSGETSLSRLSSLGLHKNLSLYNAYMQGKLVKLPFLDSIYLDREIDE